MSYNPIHEIINLVCLQNLQQKDKTCNKRIIKKSMFIFKAYIYKYKIILLIRTSITVIKEISSQVHMHYT